LAFGWSRTAVADILNGGKGTVASVVAKGRSWFESWRWRLTGLVGLLLLSACGGDAEPTYSPRFTDRPPEQATVYRFGIHPLHNPKRLFEVYQPLVDHINGQVQGFRLELEASRNYATYDERLFAGHFHFALPNPYQTFTALGHGYRVFGKMGDDENFRGIFLVRKDRGIRQVADLKGKAVSYPAPTALAATMMPQWYLHSHGLDVLRDIENRYVGSQESSIMNVYQGDVAAGATWPPPWRAFAKERPEVAAALEVIWETEPLINNGLVARRDLPVGAVEAVGRLLFELHLHAAGRAILAPMELSRFEPADDATYGVIQAFLERFEREVRPIREAAP
jgi:phosphonate transport system substrate-binding protein